MRHFPSSASAASRRPPCQNASAAGVLSIDSSRRRVVVSPSSNFNSSKPALMCGSDRAGQFRGPLQFLDRAGIGRMPIHLGDPRLTALRRTMPAGGTAS